MKTTMTERPTHSLEASIGNLSTCLYLDRDKGDYWITVPKHDLEVVTEFATIKFREEDR